MLHPDERSPRGADGLHYLDDGSNFFMTTNMNIDNYQYAVPLTTATITVGSHHGDDRYLARDAVACAPLEGDVVERASTLLQSLPLSCATTRTLPIAAFSGVTASTAGSHHYGGTPNRQGRKVNYAKEKWSTVSFAADKQAIQFHDELTHEIMALRRAWQTVNTRVEFPDTVSDEALSYFRPPEKFGQGWEMFDAKKHIDIVSLDRIAMQRQNALRQSETRRERREDAAQFEQQRRSSTRSLSTSPSRRRNNVSGSLLQRHGSSALALGASPPRTGSGSPMREDEGRLVENTIDAVDVRRLVTDKDVEALFQEDEVAKEIDSLKWDFKEFRPPHDWKLRHDRRMAALSRRAAEWRPLEMKKQPEMEETRSSRVTSMPALAPFFSSGLPVLDPKLPIPATMQGSGVSRQQLEVGHLKHAFVIRQDGQSSKPPSANHAMEGSVSTSQVVVAPVVVEGMLWGDIMSSCSDAAAAATTGGTQSESI
jgi:hypothetical protein